MTFPRTSAYSDRTVQQGGNTLETSQVTVGGSSQLLIAENKMRQDRDWETS